MMELSLKSKSIKRKPKKKRARIPENVLLPLIRPELFDGVSNWSRLQEVMGPKKEEKLKNNAVKAKTNQHHDDNRQPSTQKPNYKKKSTGSHPENVGEKVISYSGTVINGSSDDKLVAETDQLKTNSEKSPKSSLKFKNNESVNNSPKKISDYDKRNKYSEKRMTKAVAMDCEMVGTGPTGESSIIARVSIVNAYGVCLYDEFVKPKERVTDFRTSISGVRPSDLKKGKDLFQVQKDVLNIIEGRILVGHSIKHDLDVLFISHPRHLIRDTSLYKPFRELCGGKTPSLKKLTSKILGCEIQSGEHSSIEDAQAAMLLYLRQKKEWETQVKAQRKRKPKIYYNQTKS